MDKSKKTWKCNEGGPLRPKIDTDVLNSYILQIVCYLLIYGKY